jgi:hypothetical protein
MAVFVKLKGAYPFESPKEIKILWEFEGHTPSKKVKPRIKSGSFIWNNDIAQTLSD